MANTKRGLACDETSYRTQIAVVALDAYRLSDASKLTKFNEETQNALSALNDLLVSPDFGLDSLCPVLPIDRPYADRGPSGDRAADVETLLTAAVRTCQAKFVDAVLKIESNANGNVYATTGSLAPTPMKLLRDSDATCMPDDRARLMVKLDPTPIPWPFVAAANPLGPWERLQTEGNSGPIVPDVDDVPQRFPGYLSALLASQQGLSIGAATQGGTTSPKIQGELRYTLRRIDSVGDKDDGYLGRFFAFTSGNVNANKDDSKPTNPKWVGAGLGYKEILSAYPFLGTGEPGEVNKARWVEMRAKVGDVYNLLPFHRANYVVGNVALSYFLPFAHDLGGTGDVPERIGAPAYGGVTAGAQMQDRLAGNRDSAVRSAYTFERFDVYVYPLWLLSKTIGSNEATNTACLTTLPASWLQGGCSLVTLHLDRQIVNNGLGTLNELGISWGFRKGLSLAFTRSVGVQDPISNLGIKLPRSGVSQLSLKITPSGGGSN